MPIHMTARFEVQPDKLAMCERAIREFVEYVRANEPDTLLYASLQEKENPNRYLHYFVFRDERARETHSSSDAVNRFTGSLYPNLVAPVEFTEFNILGSTK
jgi:quinol monooxygenase YgiN